jgi:hypothetical protein
VNVTLIVQPAPAATVVPQLFVCAKSPVVVMLVIVNVAVPVFVSITFCAGLVVPTNCVAKVRLVGFKVTAGEDPPSPTPVRVVDSGLSGALSVTVTFAFSVPVIDGVKVTVMPQVACGATLALVQVLLSLKSAALVPVICTAETVNVALPVFVTVIVNGALVVPTF